MAFGEMQVTVGATDRQANTTGLLDPLRLAHFYGSGVPVQVMDCPDYQRQADPVPIRARIRKACGLKSRFDPLRERGLLAISEMAKSWRGLNKYGWVLAPGGLIRAHAINDCTQFHFAPNDPTVAFTGLFSPAPTAAIRLSLPWWNSKLCQDHAGSFDPARIQWLRERQPYRRMVQSPSPLRFGLQTEP
jgi:hypothetical protein